MLTKGSRYETARPFTSPDPDRPLFRGLRPRAIGPATGIITHTVKSGDRLDLLARHYYNDDRLWWRIVDANPLVLYGGDLVLDKDITENNVVVRPSMVGGTILIPRARE